VQAERRPATLQRALHRRHTEIEQVSGLSSGPAEHVPKDQNGPLTGRQMLNRGQEGQLDRFLRHRQDVGPRIGRRQIQEPVRKRLQP
jgi:hypothetical protein